MEVSNSIEHLTYSFKMVKNFNVKVDVSIYLDTQFRYEIRFLNRMFTFIKFRSFKITLSS